LRRATGLLPWKDVPGQGVLGRDDQILTTVAAGRICKSEGRSRDVTTIARDADRLRELDAGRRRAWNAYREKLSGLTGEEYELAEPESWGELQTELRRIERRRESLNRTSA
jgi:PAS domain-containing protein